PATTGTNWTARRKSAPTSPRSRRCAPRHLTRTRRHWVGIVLRRWWRKRACRFMRWAACGWTTWAAHGKSAPREWPASVHLRALEGGEFQIARVQGVHLRIEACLVAVVDDHVLRQRTPLRARGLRVQRAPRLCMGHVIASHQAFDLH